MAKIRGIVLHTVAGTIGSILIGLAFYQLRIFDLHNAAAQFVVFGASIGLLLGCARFLSLRAFIVVPVLVWALDSLVARSSTGPLLLRNAVFVLALSDAAYVSQRLVAHGKIADSVVKRAALRIGVLLIAYFAAGMMLCVVFRAKNVSTYASVYAWMGLLLAAGSVIGIELGERIIKQEGRLSNSACS